MVTVTLAAAFDHATALHRAGRLAEAAQVYRAILEASPGHGPTLHWLGVIEAQLGHLDEARRLLERAVEVDPGSAQAHCDLGNVHKAQGRATEALASYEAALAIAPDLTAALSNRGAALQELHRDTDALASCDAALAREPGNAEALNNRGAVLMRLGRREEAMAAYARAIAIRPDFAKALNNIGTAYALADRFDLAAGAFARALALQPDLEIARGAMLHARLYCADWRDWTQERATVIADVRAGRASATPFHFLSITDDPADQLLCARLAARDPLGAGTRRLWNGERYGHERIRVAYVSADLNEHAVAYLMAGVLESHDRSRFEVTAVSTGAGNGGAMGARLRRGVEHFVEAPDRAGADIARLLREREIDVAVDLGGHTGGGRGGVFAYRPAPVQVGYLGFPGTSGAEYIDYMLADRFVVPAASEVHYTERIVLLPDTFQANDAWRPIADVAPSRAEVGLPDGAFVFSSFNNNHKITPEMFDVWMRLLRAVDGSVLWMLGGHRLFEANLRREAGARGVDARRIVFAPRIVYAHHLARCGLADLFLDTLPFNAGTSASDALWAGLPVLTCAGKSFAGRMAGSLLHAAGLPELVTHSLEEYEALALALAADPARLRGLRDRLGCRNAALALFDTTRFTRHLEAAFTQMRARAESGESPSGFAVAADR